MRLGLPRLRLSASFVRYPVLVRIFCYYSTIDADVSRMVHCMSHTGFMLFLDESGLCDIHPNEETMRAVQVPTSRHAKGRGEDGWELLWISVNESAGSKEQRSWNLKARLTRNEFIEILVRAAIDDDDDGPQNPEEMPRVLQELFEDMMNVGRQPHAGMVLHDRNAFLRTYCYRREVCAVLAHHEKTLRSIYTVYSELGSGAVDLEGSSGLMGVHEFHNFVHDIGIIREIGHRTIFAIFGLSRMLTFNEASSKDHNSTLTQLTYEGFLEAVVRLALVKALPSDRDMRKHGFQFPGEFLGAMLDTGGKAYEKWVDSARSRMRKGQGDPIWRRVDMLCLLFVGVMQFGIEKSKKGALLLLRGSPDELLTKEEVVRFWKSPTPLVFERQTSS